MRVLVVEDEPLYWLQLQACLLDLGMQALGPAADAAHALALYAEHAPDMVLLDVGLSGDTDGIALAAALRAAAPALPLLFITSATDRPTFERARAVGPVAYLHKPFTLVSVQHAVELALQGPEVRPRPATPAPLPAAAATALAAPAAPESPWAEDVLLRGSFFVKHQQRLLRIARANVLAIEATNNYSVLRTADGQQYLLSLSLNRAAEMLGEGEFVRVHRSWLVNMDLVSEVSLTDNVIHTGKLIVPIGVTARAELIRRLPLLG